MNTCKIETLIVANNSTRGTGKDLTSPIRGITEVFTPDGVLIAEKDACSWNVEEVRARILAMKGDGLLMEGKEVVDVIDVYFNINSSRDW